LGLAILTGSIAEAQTICAPPAAQSALQSRVLQTRLMVAALSCGQRSDYNAFVTRYQQELIVHGKALREFFRVSYGSRAKKRLNRFVTSLANEASAVSLELGPDFCVQAGQIFADLTGLETVAFADFAADQPFANDHGVASCQAGAKTSAKKQNAKSSMN
jgi:hypothetical protein